MKWDLWTKGNYVNLKRFLDDFVAEKTAIGFSITCVKKKINVKADGMADGQSCTKLNTRKHK